LDEKGGDKVYRKTARKLCGAIAVPKGKKKGLVEGPLSKLL
jgi:hypothetical protein